MANAQGNMPLLLDGRCWVQFILGDTSIKAELRSAIEKACSQGRIYISMVSVWQVGELANSGVLFLNQPFKEWVNQAIEASGVQLCDMTIDMVHEANQLPTMFNELTWHDKLLLANARLMGAKLVTTALLAEFADQHEFIEVV